MAAGEVDMGKQKTLWKTACGITDPKKAYYYVYNPEDEELPLYICKNKGERDSFIKKRKLPNTVATGPCYGAGDNESMIFKLKKMLSNLEKKLIDASRGLGKKVTPDIRLLSEKEEKEDADSGDKKVEEIQKALKELSKKNKNFDPGPVDGKMGPKTKEAIKAFQKANGLSPDGIVGDKTQTALDAALKGGGTAAGGEPGKDAAAGKPEKDAAAGGKAMPFKLDLSGWKDVVKKALGELNKLRGAVSGTGHPMSKEVCDEIEGLKKDLGTKYMSPKPEDLDEIEKFLDTNDTIKVAEHDDIKDLCEPIKISDMLKKACAALKKQKAGTA